MKNIQQFLFTGLLTLLSVWTISAQKNITKPNVAAPNGVSVNTYTGGLLCQRQDLMIPGRGLSIDFIFSYNTVGRGRDWGLGRGWTFTYNMAYAMDSLDVVVDHMDGSRRRYQPDGSGGWYSPAGVFDSLEQYQPDQFRLTTKEGTKYFFDDPVYHRLTSIEDRNGNTISLTYTDSLLTTVTDPSGREVFLSWTNGRLTKITDPNTAPPREWTYAYDNQGNPVTATDPLGNFVQYEYDNQYKITTVINENGYPVNIEYQALDAVKSVITCVGKQTYTYSYETLETFMVERVGDNNQITTYQYDDKGRLIQQTGNCCGYNMQFEYDYDNNITKRIDANGNPTSFEYDGRGNVLREIDPLGNFIQFAYEPVYNQITSITDKNNNTTTFDYDPNGNLIQINYPLGIQETYGYDEFGNQTSYTDGEGNPTGYDYNTNGYLTQTTNAANRFTQFSYDEVGNLLTITDLNNNLTSLEYDAINRLVGMTDALNNSETYEYDSRRNRTLVRDKNNKETRFAYDALDRLIVVEDALNQQSTRDFDARSNLIKYTDENGNETQYEYNHLNRLTAVINAEGEVIEYAYDGNGNIVEARLPNGNVINIQYDALNRTVSTTDVLGAVSSFTYDKNSNQTSFTDGTGNTVTYGYDTYNRLVKITDPLDKSIAYAYDNNNNLTSIIDQNGNPTTYTYDVLNRQEVATDALNNTSSYFYDDFGNVTSITDQNNHTTAYTYDVLNRLESETHPDGKGINYVYDATGQIVQRTDENNQTIIYEYDDIYRLIRRTYPDNSKDEFTYDAVDNILTAINAFATIEFSYDKTNRTTSETLNGKTTGFTYDLANQRREIFYPGGRHITEQWDERDRLKSISDDLYLNDILADFEYDSANRLTKRSYFNNTTSDYVYDANSRLTGITHTLNNIAAYQYAFDAVGNRLKEEQIHQPTASRQFIYDGLYRLTNTKTGTLAGSMVPNPLSQIQYDLDALGNRQSVDADGLITTYTANNLNQYTSLSGGESAMLSYDDNGNLISDGVYNYDYDYENYLRSVDNGATAEYQYDALGRRIKKIIGLDTTYFYYDNLQVIEERGAGKFVEATYVYGQDLDEILSMHRNGSHYFYYEDGQGSVARILDQSGNLVERYRYDAFGNLTIFDAGANVINESNINNPYYFTGRRLDKETGLYYYRARYYSPGLGRFIQRDPLGFVDGFSLYEYGYSNPVNWVDPLGLSGSPCEKPWWEDCAVGAGLFATTGASIGALFAGVGALVGGGVGAVAGCVIHSVLGTNPLDKIREGDTRGAIIEIALYVVPVPGGILVGKAGQFIFRKAAQKLFLNTARSSTQAFKSFTKSNYRHNLQVLTGRNGVGKDAHHIFPQAERFQKYWQKSGINIHDPKNLAWWEKSSHRSAAKAYNAAWDKFFSRNPNATSKQIQDFGKELMKSHGF